MHLYLQFQSNSKFPIRSSDITRGVSVCRVPSLYLWCLFAVAQSIVETENGNACGFTLLRHATYANFTPAKAQALRNKFRCEKAKRKISKLLLRVAKTLRWISQKISLCIPWMAYNLGVCVCRLCVCVPGVGVAAGLVDCIIMQMCCFSAFESVAYLLAPQRTLHNFHNQNAFA